MKLKNAKQLVEWFPYLKILDWHKEKGMSRSKGEHRDYGVEFPDGFATNNYGTVFTKNLVNEGRLSEESL